MSFEIILLSAMTVMGAELQTTYKNNECFAAIPAFWQETTEKNIIERIPNKANPVVLGIYTNYSPDFSLSGGTYSLIIGTPVSKVDVIPAGMVVKEIPESKYAVFTAKGPFSTAVGQAWMEVWNNKEIERTFTNDFEWYDQNSTNDENSVVKIYIAIK